ncbi:MAG: hypothetical protein ACK56I_23140, partial [bacterium]
MVVPRRQVVRLQDHAEPCRIGFCLRRVTLGAEEVIHGADQFFTLALSCASKNVVTSTSATVATSSSCA